MRRRGAWGYTDSEMEQQHQANEYEPGSSKVVGEAPGDVTVRGSSVIKLTSTNREVLRSSKGRLGMQQRDGAASSS